jgi:hypothetical protein
VPDVRAVVDVIDGRGDVSLHWGRL